MKWVAFSYSSPSGSSSTRRVALWRRLRRLGAISPTGSLYFLPASDETLEAFTLLAQEIEDTEGNALVFRVENFEGSAEKQLTELSRDSCGAEYREIAEEANELEAQWKEAEKENKEAKSPEIAEAIRRLRKRFGAVERIDFFSSPEGPGASSALESATRLLSPSPPPATIPRAAAEDYRKRKWVTRPQPHVDRLACIWLIRRFIDPEAEIRYGKGTKPNEVAFDMTGAEFGHSGDRCSFETMLAAFGLDELALQAIAEIVHEIDLRDGRPVRPEIGGVDSLLRGWLVAGFSDSELESHGTALFEGLYASLQPRRGARRR